MKVCPRCKSEKEDAEFYRNQKSGRLYPYCHPCAKDYTRERREAKKAKAENGG